MCYEKIDDTPLWRPADVFFMASSPGDLFHPTTSVFLKSRVGFVMNCRKAKNTFVHDLKNIFFEFSSFYFLLAVFFATREFVCCVQELIKI